MLCYGFFYQCFFFGNVHSIGLINTCTTFEINWYDFDEIRKYAKIVFYLTSHDAKTVRRKSYVWLKQWFSYFR